MPTPPIPSAQPDAPVQIPPGYDLRFLGDVDSTNAEAARLLRNCPADSLADLSPTWILAGSQNAGRGRQGRHWASPPGNLYATLLLRPGVSADIAPQLSLAAALAVRDMILAFLPGTTDQIALKWPNDVLANGAKLAGILLESHLVARPPAAGPSNASDVLRRHDIGWIAIGIGVNLRHSPPQSPYPATSLHHLGCPPVEPAAALCKLAWSLHERLSHWHKGAGFAALRAQWMRCAYGLGAQVSVGLGPGAGEMHGTFLGLDDNGALRLRLPTGGECSLCAADVRFLRPEPLPTPEAACA